VRRRSATPKNTTQASTRVTIAFNIVLEGHSFGVIGAVKYAGREV
jgi:hypothetical protein